MPALKKSPRYIRVVTSRQWQQVRRLVFERDEWACRECGHHDPTGRSL